MKIRAFAKINPFLRILGTRPDGYHDLELIFLPISLHDTLEAEPNQEGLLRLTCTDSSIPIENNLITMAWRMVKQDHPELPGLDVMLIKGIPSGAGLGGGSADAAAFLRLLKPLCGLELPEAEFYSYAARLGADVPALLLGSPSLGGGIGEVLAPLKNRAVAHLLIVSPGFSCNTGEMYGRYDHRQDLWQPESSKAVRRALEEGDLRALGGALFNVFEQLLDPEQQALVEEIKAQLLAQGAAGALMTGSGSCVFGLFATEEERDQAAEELGQNHAVYPTFFEEIDKYY